MYFQNTKINFKVFFFLLTSIQNDNWVINSSNNSFLSLFEFQVHGYNFRKLVYLIIQTQTFKGEVLNKQCIFESGWNHAAVCIADHKHLSYAYPYIDTKACCQVFCTPKTISSPCLGNQGNSLGLSLKRCGPTT